MFKSSNSAKTQKIVSPPKPRESNVESIEKLDIEKSPFGISEAERKLDFNLLPNKMTQRKIDLFITPYNQRKIIHKHMNFNSDEEANKNIDGSQNK
jgi:hypothetical protein